MAMAMKEIDVNGRVLSVNPGVTALVAVKAIRDMESLQGGIILENGTRIVLDTEILSELTGRLSFNGGQPVGTDRKKTSLSLPETIHCFILFMSFDYRIHLLLCN